MKVNTRIRTLSLTVVLGCPLLLGGCEAPSGLPPEAAALFEIAAQALEGIGLIKVIKTGSPPECEGDERADCP